MASRDLAMGIVFLSQTLVGILGNFSLFYNHLFRSFSGCRLRATDLIIEHLSIANSLFLIFKGVPETMAVLGLRHFINDLGCKLIFYIRRVGKGVSMGSTCLLSVFQAITISPRDSRLAELKMKVARYTSFSVLLCWALQLLVNIAVPMQVSGIKSSNNITKTKDFLYCSVGLHDKIGEPLRAALLSFPDVLCLGIMSWASSSMVSILRKHKQQVQYIHGNRFSSRSSPESRATKTILLLVSTFVSLNTLSFIFQVGLGISDKPNNLMLYFFTLTSAGFPVVSPFVLMNRDAKVSRLCFTCMKNRISAGHHDTRLERLRQEDHCSIAGSRSLPAT